jgi:hypothetical protein
MIKFLVRVTILLGIAGLFLAAVVVLIEFTGKTPFWSRHHGINLAYLGTFLIVASMSYSLRKYKLLKYGLLGLWLKGHIVLGGTGLLFVYAHAGLGLRAWVPVFSLGGMVLVGLTGLFGWYMYLTKVKALLSEIRSLEEAEEYFLAKMASSAFRFWRFVHILATYTAFFFTIAHVMSLVVFRGFY